MSARPILSLGAWLAVGWVLSGCTNSAGGPEYVDFGISAIEDVGESFPQTCLPVPLLPGGHTEKDVTFGGAFSANVDAQRDQVDVTFLGVNTPDLVNRSLPREALEVGYAETDLRIETLEGRRFTVSLVSPCKAPTVVP